MNLFTAEQLAQSYGMKQLFAQLSFSMADKERVGLIGINGTGKSTLLKMIAGVETPDNGKLAYQDGLRIAYLSQNPAYQATASVLEQVLKLNTRVDGQVVQDAPSNVQIGAPFDDQQQAKREAEAKTILTKLGITQFNLIMSTLSGGQRKRVLLASVLMQEADLLILDEPTNHLDTQAVDWLESYLTKSSAALLMITHDRYFLDRVVTRIIELDQGALYSYEGSYSVFLEKKAERMDMLQASEKKRQNLYRNELAWMRRGAKARSTKQKARIDRFHEIQDAKANLAHDQVDISTSSSRLGKKVIELQHISKSYEGNGIIHPFEHVVQKHDRIGIIGPNGSGKSTLLKMISGQLSPDRGNIDVGTTVKIGFFSQENEEMNRALRVIDYIKSAAEYITTSDGSQISASQMLERFLFPPSLQWNPIANLSGGEQRRLFLLRILMEAPNVLLLDEPTNDLDIQTLTILEDYIDQFDGAVLAVSHDRYFLDRITETIFSFSAGRVETYVGNYSDYREFDKRRQGASNLSSNSSAQTSPAPSAMQKAAQGTAHHHAHHDVHKKEKKTVKFSFHEQREFEHIDDQIAEAEQRLRELTQAIHEAGSDYLRLQVLTEQQQEQAKQLDALMDRWAYLHDLAEQIAANKNVKS